MKPLIRRSQLYNYTAGCAAAAAAACATGVSGAAGSGAGAGGAGTTTKRAATTVTANRMLTYHFQTRALGNELSKCVQVAPRSCQRPPARGGLVR